MQFGETYKLVEVRQGREWVWFTQSMNAERLKAKWPGAKVFNRYGEEV